MPDQGLAFGVEEDQTNSGQPLEDEEDEDSFARLLEKDEEMYEEERLKNGE